MFRTPRATTDLLSTATAVLGLVGLLTVFSAQEVKLSQTWAEWLEERPWIVELTCRSGWPKNRAWRPECSSRRSRCVCQRAKPPPHRLSGQHSVRETPHRRSDSVAEQFDSLTDAIIPHLTGQSTPTKAKGSATESELRLSVAGQAGVNLMDFCKLFNARTAKYKEGLELPVKLQAYNDRTFDFTVATPPASYFLKAAVRNYPISVSSCTDLLLATLLTTLSGHLSPKGF